MAPVQWPPSTESLWFMMMAKDMRLLLWPYWNECEWTPNWCNEWYVLGILIIYWSNIVCMCICCGCYASNSAYAICLTLCNVSESGMELLLWQSLTQSLMLFAKNWSDYGTTVTDKSVNMWLQEDRHHLTPINNQCWNTQRPRAVWNLYE